jgi:hypothetical protein
MHIVALRAQPFAYADDILLDAVGRIKRGVQHQTDL